MGVSTALDAEVAAFAEEVGETGPVSVVGLGTRGGASDGERTVSAPVGIDWIEPAEMTLRCGAGTPVAEIEAALAEHGQCVAMPSTGTVGGALAVGHSGMRRLGWGPVRDTLLQVRYVSAAGAVVKGGGPTVKNVSGFDLCRLIVGSRGTLGFIGDVILRTRPRPLHERWFRASANPWDLLAGLYRPTSLLWDGTTAWVLLDGHPDDVAEQARRFDLEPVAGPPDLPPHRWSLPPSALPELPRDGDPFVAEVGVGVVHHSRPAKQRVVDPVVAALNARVKAEFDPSGRLNPGVEPLSSD